MGNLHEGHRSLLRAARAENELVVATIFVNPLQFGPNEDFHRYPRTPEADRQMCCEEGVDVVFSPQVASMYPGQVRTRVEVRGLADVLCGRFRPGHFSGVATVVAKLLHLAPAHVAYFGQKDYQQTLVIRQMVADLDFPIEIRVCPTVREADGLAMSSRNAHLTATERMEASALYGSLCRAQELLASGERDAEAVRRETLEFLSSRVSAAIEYLELVDPENLQPVSQLERPTLAAIAARFSAARLIDNLILVP